MPAAFPPPLAFAAEPAHGGRLFARAARFELEGPFELLPKPLGAWPRSVVLPCAFHVRELFVARLLLLPGMLFCMRRLLPEEGGRL